MQFHVPQNIDMEDKIVGPLTIKQFLICVVGGSIVYLLFKGLGTSGRIGLFLLTGGPIGLATIMLAFLKVQDRPFGEFFLSLVVYTFRPQKRIWQREQEKSGQIVKEEEVKKERQEAAKKAPTKEHLHSLSQLLDQPEKNMPEATPEKTPSNTNKVIK